VQHADAWFETRRCVAEPGAHIMRAQVTGMRAAAEGSGVRSAASGAA
jgi:hypothetical protein